MQLFHWFWSDFYLFVHWIGVDRFTFSFFVRFMSIIHCLSLHAHFLSYPFFFNWKIRLQLRLRQLLLRICCACWFQVITYTNLWRPAFYVREQFAFSCVCSNCCYEYVVRAGFRSLHTRLCEGVYVRKWRTLLENWRIALAHKTPSKSRVCIYLKPARTAYS